MIKITEERLTNLVLIMGFVVVGAAAYTIGVQTVDSHRLAYYEMGLADGYQQGMDHCGDAGVRKLDSNGTQWLRYEPKNVFDEWDHGYPVTV